MMGLNDTPRGERLHIGIFGRRNAGKSSLINALTGQDAAIVSAAPGTTADPVFKSMELHPIGPVVFIDTAGFDDKGDLGDLRVARTEEMIRLTDLAILVIDGTRPFSLQDEPEREWIRRFDEAGVPVITVINKCDGPEDPFPDPGLIHVSARTGSGLDALRKAIRDSLPEEYMRDQILGSLLKGKDLVLLVMPQDIQAPKGRLILPQVQTIRELLDRRCVVVSTTAEGLGRALSSLKRPPDLIITDSQCFSEVYKIKPETSSLTSFSVLLAASKGDIDTFLDGASAIDDAEEGTGPFCVLIAEACTHLPLNEDIGTVKIPKLLRKRFGPRLHITSVRGNDFPGVEDLKKYDLIVHCGACMFNRRHVMNRIGAARKAGVPITNYGVLLAKMAGILDRITYPQ